MGKYSIKDDYAENLKNLYYDDAPANGVIWQPDVYRYAVAYAKKHNIKNIVDIGSGNGDKLFSHKDEFNITFIDFGANLDIIKGRFKDSDGKHSYIDQDFEKSFPDLPVKIIKDAVVICADVIEHIRDMDKLCKALVAYSKTARLLLVSTPDRCRLYGFDQSGIPNNPCHVREWRMDELRDYFSKAGMNLLIGLTRTNDRDSHRATLCVISGRDFLAKKGSIVLDSIATDILRKYISKEEIVSLCEARSIVPPQFEENFMGLLNPYDDNYMLKHFLAALKARKSYSINKFKFITSQAGQRAINANIESLDRTLLQFVGSSRGEYPLAFTFLYDGNAVFGSPGNLITLSAEQLYVDYMPELLLGCDLWDTDSETLARLPNYISIQNELDSHLRIKRSARLLAGNIKRKLIQYGRNR